MTALLAYAFKNLTTAMLFSVTMLYEYLAMLLVLLLLVAVMGAQQLLNRFIA